MTEGPILIIGAGIVGLSLAQSLKKADIPFQIFERDDHSESRSPGWGITIHWALETLKSCLPEEVFARLDEAQVDPEQGRNDTGRFLFLDLSNAVPKYVIPPAPRLRLSRRKFREVLLDGIDVNWGRAIKSFDETENGVKVYFVDGGCVNGRLLVGADGSKSKTREVLCQDTWQLHQLPVRFMGVTVKIPPSVIAPLRAIDPLLFQGCHPDTGVFMWFSILSTPKTNGSYSTTESFYEGQISLSWKYKTCKDEIPATDKERLAKMKKMAAVFEKRLKDVIESIPETTEVTEIKLQDWPDVEWPSYNEKIVLIGDAAHAMTMYRGEAANHGITDAFQLSQTICSFIPSSHSYPASFSPVAMFTQEAAIRNFTQSLHARTSEAVLLSRQACLDAHDLANLKDDSPLVSRRAVVRTKATSPMSGP